MFKANAHSSYYAANRLVTGLSLQVSLDEQSLNKWNCVLSLS